MTLKMHNKDDTFLRIDKVQLEIVLSSYCGILVLTNVCSCLFTSENVTETDFGPLLNYIRGLTIKFANSPPCACRGSSSQKPQYGLITLAHQRFTAVLLLIYGSLFLIGVYYCQSVFWCAVARMSELEIEHLPAALWLSCRLSL
jgi:hypothetical protein